MTFDNEKLENLSASDFYATMETIGEWEGREQEALEGFNSIINAGFKKASKEMLASEFDEFRKRTWNVWGSEESLPTISSSEIETHVQNYIE